MQPLSSAAKGSQACHLDYSGITSGCGGAYTSLPPPACFNLIGTYYRRYEKMYRSLEFTEWWMDMGARAVTAKAWVRGLFTVGGLQGAHRAAAGLA